MHEIDGSSSEQDPELPPVDALLDLEEESSAVADLLIDKPPANNSALWLLISLGVFIFSQAGGFDIAGILLLVGVLFFHESGHYLGMLLFGYRDVRMFFIPFFGAAVSGRKHAAPAWQQLIVMLLGPLPGIVLGAALYFALHPLPNTSLHAAVMMLIGLNGFNLFPILPLDGGRVMHLLIFRRHPVLEALFRLLAAAALGGLAWFSGSLILAVIAIVLFVGIGFQYNISRRGRKLRFLLPQLASDWKATDPIERREIFREAQAMLPGDTASRNIATRMLMLHEAAAQRSPSVIATLGFVMLYASGFFAVMAVVGDMVGERRERQVAAQALVAELEQASEEAERLLAEALRLEVEGGVLEAERARVSALKEIVRGFEMIDQQGREILSAEEAVVWRLRFEQQQAAAQLPPGRAGPAD